MKNRKKELDVDFIGGQNKPLTAEELRSISDFIKQMKENFKKKRNRKTRTPKNNLPEKQPEPLSFCCQSGELTGRFSPLFRYLKLLVEAEKSFTENGIKEKMITAPSSINHSQLTIFLS